MRIHNRFIAPQPDVAKLYFGKAQIHDVELLKAAAGQKCSARQLNKLIDTIEGQSPLSSIGMDLNTTRRRLNSLPEDVKIRFFLAPYTNRQNEVIHALKGTVIVGMYEAEDHTFYDPLSLFRSLVKKAAEMEKKRKLLRG